MEQAWAAIHQANRRRLPLRLVYGSRDGSVGLFLHSPADLVATVQGHVLAHYPDCELERVDGVGPAVSATRQTWQQDVWLTPDLFPIRRYGQFEDLASRTMANPLAAILSALAVSPRGACRGWIELVVRPAGRRRPARARACLVRLERPFFRSHPMLAALYARSAMSHSYSQRSVAWLLSRLAARGVADKRDSHKVSGSTRHEREDDLQAAGDKLSRLLFEARLSLFVAAPVDREPEAREMLARLAGTISQYSLPRLATFELGRIRRGGRTRFARPFLLSTEELATLFHPPTDVIRSPKMSHVESRELEPPVALPNPSSGADATLLGRTAFRNRRERFGLLPDDRLRHLAILGKTGMGKSTLLENLIVRTFEPDTASPASTRTATWPRHCCR